MSPALCSPVPVSEVTKVAVFFSFFFPVLLDISLFQSGSAQVGCTGKVVCSLVCVVEFGPHRKVIGCFSHLVLVDVILTFSRRIAHYGTTGNVSIPAASATGGR